MTAQGSLYDIVKDTHHPHLTSDQPNLINEDVEIPNIDPQADSKDPSGSPGSIHSIFFS